ncbi:MAG: DDE-type integrase/transposase/recombinase [Acidobacteria bacterium]|nr:DDE-type integrase/transposase/recombinase [Acidobacteriota bacterium]
MLTNQQFELWCKRIGFSKEAQILISQIRNTPPARSVNSMTGNVTARFPSRKMGAVIQAESHKNELAFIREHDGDDDVLEFYDQPNTIKLDYEAANGRRVGVLHTPDFFILRTDEAGWEECKTEEKLVELSGKSPNRYFKDQDGRWRCSPGERYAAAYGFYYRLRSMQEINWTYQRNLEFLDDYYRNDGHAIRESALTSLRSEVIGEPGLSLKDLLRRTQGTADYDDVFMLIARGELYVNLRLELLTKQDEVRVFPDEETADAYKTLIHTTSPSWRSGRSYIELQVNSVVYWGDKRWTIVNVCESAISLVGEADAFTEIPISAFEKLVQEGRISGITPSEQTIHPEVKRRLSQANQQIFIEANHRYHIVRAFMQGDPLPKGNKVAERTIRYWKSKYCAAQMAYGNGYIGLLSQRKTGNTMKKLPEQSHALMDEFIDNEYETHKQKSKHSVYSIYRQACIQRGVLPASYKTFCRAVKQRSRYIQTLKRQGHKRAYDYKESYKELTPTTPRHGEYPLHIAHIDHTQLDEELVCSETGRKLGRPWATFLTDAFSRRMAVYLTYDPPSYRSNMMILRECVRRFGRLPQIIVVDGGRDFSSTYFETVLARYECTKKTRPPSEGRFGSVSERLFGTAHTQFIYNLQGNTQVMRNVRQVTKAVNPKENAIWTLEQLYIYLCKWAYEVYETIEHPALGLCPRDAYARGLANTGERAPRLITYNEEFRILTLPTTAKSTAKVVPSRGVKINYIYYFCEAFRDPKIQGERVEIRYEPFDIGRSYAYARGQWVECYSEHHAILRNRSELELMIATAELRTRRTLHSKEFNVTAAKLASFFQSIESEEILLRQRMIDRESRNLYAIVPRNTEQRNPVEKSHNPTVLKIYEEF